MPKVKTKKGVAKRFKLTKSGKVKRHKAGRGHLLSKKTTKRKRKLRRRGLIAKTDVKTVKILLPY